MSNDADSLVRILCLHGKHQTQEILRTRIGRLPKKLSGIAECVFIDGPVVLPLREGEKVATRSWWETEGHPQEIQHSFEDAIAYLERVWAEKGPFQGVLGFSMGASIACAMAGRKEGFPGLRFVIAASAKASPLLFTACDKVDVPSLHLGGQQDRVVPLEDLETVASSFVSPEVCTHEQGHCFPTRASWLAKVVDFVQRQCLENGDIKDSSMDVCVNEDIVVEQKEEVESILSIYPEVEVRVQAAEEVGQPCAVLAVELQSLNPDVLVPLTLVISFTPNYPIQRIPHIRIEHNLSLADFSSQSQQALLEQLESEAKECVGNPSVFSLISAAEEWLLEPENVKTGANMASSVVDDGEEEEEIDACWRALQEVEEEEETEMVKTATAEAYAVFRKRLDSKDESVAHGRGTRRFVAGLVGKPSAGKSTFFNCVTRLQNEAKVGAHPFTTIEPNYGVGWWASMDTMDHDNTGSTPTRHGRTSKGHRLLPLVIKDVAGLIPGAYKGHGKGNKFLADLCDADFLLHIIDASGESDKNGVQVLEHDGSASNPKEDVEWVREELHRWIHGNIMDKWRSVIRAAKNSRAAAENRIFELFSGYKCTKSTVKLAAERGQLNLQEINKIDRLGLHRLVAHFLTVRFPMLLVLNKCDKLLKRGALGKVEEARVWAVEAGYVAVPCSAHIESTLLRYASANKIKYALGDTSFTVLEESLSDTERAHLQEAEAFIGEFGSSGVLAAISEAVALRRPLLVYPLGHANDSRVDCLQCLPGSTVDDVFEALKSGEVESFRLAGDFVRAEAMSLKDGDVLKQVGRDMPITTSTCCVRILTNKKISWQKDKDKKQQTTT